MLNKMFWRKKKVIGRFEKVSLPEFDIYDIDSKIDTGAYRGAIHASSVEEMEEDGCKVLKVVFLDDNHGTYDNKEFYIKDYKKTTVKNSIGGKEERYIIRTKLLISGEELEVDLGISNRENMRYPMIVGRHPLKKKFLVDVSKEFLG